MNPSLLRPLLVVVLVAGLLDATAVFNTATFGVGAYIVASGVAAIAVLSASMTGQRVWIDARVLSTAAFCVVALWGLVALQIWHQVGRPTTLFTQVALRTILVGHLVVCVTLLRAQNDDRFPRTVLAIFMACYVLYGLYDLAAQFQGYPRFLNGLRNSSSVVISEAAGAQGWIRLPRLSSLAAEPSHTVVPIALALFVAARLRGWKRILLIVMALVFSAGTFARTVWGALAGAALLSGGLWIAARVLPRRAKERTDALVLVACLIAPVIALTAPLLVPASSQLDISVQERVDSSRVALWLFLENPFLGIGFMGWEGRFFQFETQIGGSTAALASVHNGVAFYLASLGLAGLALVYAPLLLIMRAEGLTPAQKGWWIGIYSFALAGGDYLALPSTWTAIAVALAQRGDTTHHVA